MDTTEKKKNHHGALNNPQHEHSITNIHSARNTLVVRFTVLEGGAANLGSPVSVTLTWTAKPQVALLKRTENWRTSWILDYLPEAGSWSHQRKRSFLPSTKQAA